MTSIHVTDWEQRSPFKVAGSFSLCSFHTENCSTVPLRNISGFVLTHLISNWTPICVAVQLMSSGLSYTESMGCSAHGTDYPFSTEAAAGAGRLQFLEDRCSGVLVMALRMEKMSITKHQYSDKCLHKLSCYVLDLLQAKHSTFTCSMMINIFSYSEWKWLCISM